MVHEGLLLYANVICTVLLFLYIYRIRRLIGFQLGMNISMIAGGMLAITTGVLLIAQFPLQFAPVTIITAVLGMVVGAIFGVLFDYQTMLTGWANGLMMGLMAPMIGAVTDGSMLFIWFMELSLLVAFSFVAWSARGT
ncbi:putative membrane protein [Bacillus mesophilus]|uniref:Uncharacterized protein n=1 Tax=Bacillus mesophilus TaxID=1808955 RepID=A0A6M0QA01_9BACI|nr:putative membrane protein [Bacillus mesophilus]NEY73196.1 hypothetical protein [Bacillus mesophilus]